MVFYATLNNISVLSWGSVLLVEEAEVPGAGENHRPYHKWVLAHSSSYLYKRYTIIDVCISKNGTHL
jgi:hypothetical protein